MGYKLIEREVLKKKLRGELEYYLHHNTLSPHHPESTLFPSLHRLPFTLLGHDCVKVRKLTGASLHSLSTS